MGKRAVITILAAVLGSGGAVAVEVPVPGLTPADCQAPTSASVQALCTDPGLRQLIDSVQDVPYVRLGRTWTVDEAMFQRCDATLDARACLDREYRVKIKAVQAESAKRAMAYAPDGSKADAKALLARIAGIYRHPVRTGDGAHGAEDVLQVTPVADGAAYLDMRLSFHNGQNCAITGIAEYKKIGSFVFQDPAPAQRCMLTMTLSGDEVGFSDPTGACAKFCGEHASLTAETFVLKQKKKLRTLPALRQSPAYQEALQAYQARHATAKATP
ncbi:hypothetical protein FBZ89_11980 [Nitrospirillum amazonense]|uniref:YARHG domain-containing protein n=1 Tax=Nitrospirillum amazonense TaxID=28077 RepID=A0A560EX87_9PROT|nr:hypothetical protein [Nitrospirillum amazonense]TWB13865.1 hypothetical protein FBZ89_11980 [Nitrospirillum amazonense]